MLPCDVKYRIMHHSSKSCPGLRVVDYFNWAIFRRWERKDSRSWKLVRGAIASEFDIFSGGVTYFY